MTTPTPAPIYLDDGQPPIEPYEFGLLSVARVITGNGQWQIGGVQYDTDNCAEGGYVVGWCPTPTGPAASASATFTAPADEAFSFTVYPANATDLDMIRVVTSDNRPLPVTVTIEEHRPAATLNEAASAGMTAVLDIDNTQGAVVAEHTFTPGEAGWNEWVTQLAPGTYDISGPNCRLYEFTIPLADPPDPEQPLLSCPNFGQGVTIEAPAANAFPITYVIGTQSGTLAPGASAHLVVAAVDGNNVSIAAPTGQRTAGVLPIPGTVSLTVQQPGPTSHDKPNFQGLNQVNGCGPFTVYHRAECNSVGWANQDVQDIARRRLELVEQQWAEEGFWDLCLYGRLDQAIKPLGEEPVAFKQGLGGLQQHAARYYNGKPTFHVPRWVFPYFQQQDQVRIVDDVQRTYLNEKVAFGAGYWNNSSPGPGGAFWVFATGAVTARRSEPLIHEPVLDIPTNTYMALAERTYAFDTDCLLMAVLLTVDGMG